jgi:hypothetical protein
MNPSITQRAPERNYPEMSVIIIATAFPIPEHRAEVIAAFEEGDHPRPQRTGR